jgi:hypothetical protein
MNNSSTPKRIRNNQEIRRIRKITTKYGDERYVVQHQFVDGAEWRFMKYTDPVTRLRVDAIFNDREIAHNFMEDPDMFEVQDVDEVEFLLVE